MKRPDLFALGAAATAALLLAPAVLGAGSTRSDRAGSGHPNTGDLRIHTVLPRGAIPAILDPEFVPAAEAGLPEDEPVLGYRVGDEAHVYSLNLLNHHEIVNDAIDGEPFAATW